MMFFLLIPVALLLLYLLLLWRSPRKKRFLFISLTVVAVAIGSFWLYDRSLTRDDLIAALRAEIAKTNGQILVVSPKHQLRISQKEETPFHIASVGKLLTTVVIAQLVAEKKLSYTTKIATLLPAQQLNRLFVVAGRDYRNEVTVEQLLAHTSGVADYFGAKSFQKDIVEQRDKRWTPEQLISFSQTKQQAIARPGTKFHYSDTGYILLGLLVERVEQQPFHHSLRERIFTPLHMDDSYLMFAEQGKKPIAPLYLNGVDVSTFTSVSCDWAGGGVVSTLDDLLKFQTALHNGQLLPAAQTRYLFSDDHSFREGIHYGKGTMTLHFDELFFLLRDMPHLQGHIGITATQLFYDRTTDTHFIMNFGDSRKLEESFKTLIPLVRTVQKLDSMIQSN